MRTLTHIAIASLAVVSVMAMALALVEDDRRSTGLSLEEEIGY